MSLLEHLRDDDQALLLSLQQARTLAPGTILFHQGAPSDAAVFVRRGRLALQLFAPGQADPVHVHNSLPGELVGEPALVAGGTRSRTAVAVEETEIGVVHRADLKSLLSSFHPASLRIVLAVARHVAGRMQSAHVDATPGVPVLADMAVPATMDPRPFLPIFPFFRDFTPADIESLLAQGTLWDVERGTRLLQTGQRSDSCFLVVRGAIAVRASGARIALIGPGALAGEMAPLTGRPATADLMMRESGTLLHLGPDAFLALTTPGERVAFKFTNALATTLMASLARTNRQRARQAMHHKGAP